MRFPVVLLCLLPLAAAWSFDDPDQWVNEYPTCGGPHQSPIAIESSALVPADLPPLKFDHYDELFADALTIANNGQTIEIKVPKTTSGSKPTISGGLLKGNYTAETVHFHWGSSMSQGSEHQIDGTQYPLEMHIVHKNSKYDTTNEASHHEDGLAVIAVLFQYSMDSSVEAPGIEIVLEALPELTRYRSTAASSDDYTMGSFLGYLDDAPYITGDEFITYHGSLTTPPCSEAVTWIVFKKLLPVIPSSAYQFFNILQKNGKTLTNIFRPVQPIGDRKVYWRGA